MQVNSIRSFSTNCCQPRKLMDNTQNPEPTTVANPVPEASEGNKASVYFTGKDSSKNMRRILYVPVIVAGLGGASALHGCLDEPEAYAKAEASAWAYAEAHAGRDTIFRDDTVYVDTGSYHVDHDTIIKWKDNYVRPIPLDSLMKNLINWGSDGSDGANIFDGLTKRNVIHYEGTREWEYNNREVGDMDVLASDKYTLIYNTEIKDYKGNHKSFGKTVFRIPTSPFMLISRNGLKVSSPKGFFVEMYDNNTDNANASIYDCTRRKQYFCQTEGDTLRVYSKNADGVFEEDGAAAKGYLESSSILFKNLIGRYDTDDHLVKVHVTAVDDETLKYLYVRKRDDAEAEN